MATDPSTSERILGAARALLQERKTLSLAEIRDYLRTVAQIAVPESEVEDVLGRLLNGPAENLAAIALHQAFLFKWAARGFWRSQYSFLIVQQTYHPPQLHEWRDLYLVFGLAGDGEVAEKFLGIGASPAEVLKRLESDGIFIEGWFPLTQGQCTELLAHTKDVNALVEKFGAALYTADGTRANTFIRVC